MATTTWRLRSQRQILLASCLTFCTIVSFGYDASATSGILVAKSTKKDVAAIDPATQGAFGQLKELLQSTKYLRRSALDMVNEVEQNKWVFSTFPEDLGSPVAPTMKDKDPNENLIPASKKWTKFIVDQMEPLFGTLKKDIDAIEVPENKKGTTKEDLDKLDALMQKLESAFANMKTLCAAEKLDNLAIGRQAVGIYDLCGKMEDLVPTISHDLRDNQ